MFYVEKLEAKTYRGRSTFVFLALNGKKIFDGFQIAHFSFSSLHQPVESTIKILHKFL
jgi:hypothetical protein